MTANASQDIELEVSAMYLTFFKRPPDVMGYQYWRDVMRRGGIDLQTVADAFNASLEFQANYAGLTPAQQIAKVYRHLLDRDPDLPGLQHWLGVYETYGRLSDVIKFIVPTALSRGLSDDDGRVITYKAMVGSAVTAEIQALGQTSRESDILSWAARDLLPTIDSTTANINGILARLPGLVQETWSRDTVSHVDTLYKTFTKHIDRIDVMPSLSDKYVLPLLSEYKWNNKAISIGFPDVMPQEYTQTPDYSRMWKEFPSDFRTSAVDVVSKALTPIDVILPFRSDGMAADIRVSLSSNKIGTAREPWVGLGSYPSVHPLGGDIVIDRDHFWDKIHTGGSAVWATLIHELGHAFGLKHPFEGTHRAPAETDNYHYTIMSYNNGRMWWPNFEWEYVNNRTSVQTNYTYVARKDFGIHDIATLTALYGPSLIAGAGDTLISIPTPSPQTWTYKTLYDASGTDTLDFSTVAGKSIVNLQPGTLSSINFMTIPELYNNVIQKAKEYYAGIGVSGAWLDSWLSSYAEALKNRNDNHMIYNGQDNFGIAYGVIIENVVTGRYDDVIFDNHVDNIIMSGAGNDVIHLGAGGFDIVYGGEGLDTVRVPHGPRDISITRYGMDVLLSGPTYGARLIGVEAIQFSDGHSLSLAMI